jgi:hypothetical protein
MDELDRERERLKLAHRERLREKQPAVVKRRAKREAAREAERVAYEESRARIEEARLRCAGAGAAERAAGNWYESLAATVDLTSRALAPFIPRLIIHVGSQLASLEFEIALGYRNIEENKTKERADRAREFLAQLEAIPRAPVCASCGGPLVGKRRGSLTCSPACRQRRNSALSVTDKTVRKAKCD